MNYAQYTERKLLHKVYKNGEYFFDDGIRNIEMLELEIKAIQAVQQGHPITPNGIHGKVTIDGIIKVPIVFSAWFDGGDPFDIYVKKAKYKKLELAILGVVFISYGPDYVTYAAREYMAL